MTKKVPHFEVPDWVRWTYDDEPVYDSDRRSYWVKHAEFDWSLVTDEEMYEAECNPQMFHIRNNNGPFVNSEGTFLLNTFTGTKAPETADEGTMYLDSSSGDIYVFSGAEWVLLAPESGVTYIPQDSLVSVDPPGKIDTSQWDSSFATMHGGR